MVCLRHLALVALMVYSCTAEDDCSGRVDGTITSWACRAYTVCQDEKPQIVDCWEKGLVFNEAIMDCDSPKNTKTRCCCVRNCKGKANGNYADLFTGCQMYYTCHNGLFFGHQYCQPGLVFDERYGTCNWVASVPAPCGTAK